MSATPSPTGWALTFMVLGSLVMMTATACLLSLHEPVWRYVLAGGAAVHVAGWLLHGRRARRTGGAA
ncbi:hypothetical protein AB0I16_03735 [Streptomyces sp. NPDC050703]|uniref:hypothetical protein n=1 Tax=Streptomyces sp. NPDC050703 TaxID=3157218 RepID=UPI00342C96D3